MADDEEFRALDIGYTQVVVHVGAAADRECPYHHRILLRRVSGAFWVCLTPNLERFVMDLDQEEYSLIRRNALFPDHTLEAGLLYHDPISPVELRQHARAAREEAHLQGGDGEAADLYTQWRFSDPTDAKFGQVVDADYVEDPAAFSELSGHGLVLIDGAVHSCQLVENAELDEWKTKTASDSHGGKLLVGGAPRSLHAYLESSKQAERNWRFDGSRVCREWLQAVSDGPGNFTSYHSEWVRLSGIAEGASQAHEHRQICECLRLALMDDHLDIGNLAVFEQLSRRIVQVEMAVEKNPKHPDFSGLGVLVDTNVSAGGAARVPKFTQWVTQRHKEQAEIFKQRRLFHEEAGKASHEPRVAQVRAPKAKAKGKPQSG